jgi:dipeptidyl aminopeptidase/acylaminoacyl peptidase
MFLHNRLLPTHPRSSWASVVVAALFAVAALLACAASLFAQPTPAPEDSDRAHIEDVLNGITHGHNVGQVAVSPDGKRLAWIEGARSGGDIHVAPLDDLKKSERVTAASKSDQHCREGQLAWAHDSRTLAFFSDCARLGEQVDLYLSHLDGKAAQRLTTLNGYVEDPAFSPDGSHIAFLYVDGATRPSGALAAMKLPSGVIGEDGVEIQRIAAARADATKPGPAEMISPASLHVYEFDWSPDSKSLAYVAAEPPGENNWWVAKLYTQAPGAAPIAILAPATVAGPLHGLQIAVPRWSPDGKAIAFIGGLMSDQGSTGGDVWIVSSTGGASANLTPSRPTSPAWIDWDGNDHIYVSELAAGNDQLVRMSIVGDKSSDGVSSTFAEPVFNIPATVGDGLFSRSLSATAGHTLFVFTASSFDVAPDMFGAVTGRPTVTSLSGLLQLSHVNDGVRPNWGRSESLSWKNDSFSVQGWLTLPRDYNPTKKYPLIVIVHGGPGAAEGSQWPGWGSLSAAPFSALGYFVLQPNPRGSFGQGEAFTQANVKDFGYGDLRDILAGVDAVEARYPIDPQRVGLTGWSYGGFMSMFAVTQTHRFRAAVAGAGISDWLSYYGENSIDQWMIPFFGASVYDDPAVYAKSSAITYIKQTTTPTLVVVGDRDGECPAPQSYEFWHALRDLHVPTQLVVYPNEGHGFVDPAHRRDVAIRGLEWFARYMPPSE